MISVPERPSPTDPNAAGGHPPEESSWVPLSANETPSSLSGRRAKNWALVLEARRIPCQVRRAGWAWQVFVPILLRETALKEVALFEEENSNWPPHQAPLPLADNTLPTLSALGLLAIFHNLTYLDLSAWGLPAIDWLGRGDADAGKILAGEWWRTVTALTLHVDGLHLLGNIAIGGFFITLVCRALGSGLGWSLILLSGSFGNLLNAWLQSPTHRAIGASTAVFGAVGLLASLSVMRNRAALLKKWPLPLAAALALLAMLGAEGERVDIGAHLWGCAAGLGFGAAAGLWLRARGHRPGRLGNALLTVAAILLPLLAWQTALRLP